MYKSKMAIMATGGMDSTVIMYENVENNPQIITVNYGQVAFSKQIENLNYHIRYLKLSPLKILNIEYDKQQCKKGLFKEKYIPNENNPLEDWNQLRYEDFFIEGRNLIMIAHALGYCSSNKIDQLLVGYLYGEEEWTKRRTYKLMTGDNSPQFVDCINIASQFGFSHQVRIRAPFYERLLSKKDVYDLGINLGINFDKTYSCYFIPPCGKCDNCLLRNEILKGKYDKL